jgi:hypothetical protein
MTTPNMNLTLPVVSQTPGPTWASEINADLAVIDAHNHTSGKGALVPVAGLDIDADLSLATHALTDVTKAVLLDQGSVATLNAVYAVGGDLYWTNGGGTPVQITSGNSVNVGVTGNISGMIGSCSVAYDSGTLSYEFLDENGNRAALLGSSVQLSSLTLYPGVGAIAYTLRFPPAPPAAASFVLASASGSVASLSYLTQAGGITRSMQAAVGEQIGTSSNPSVTSTFPTFTSVTSAVTVTSSGRPIMIGLMSDESSSPSYAHIRFSSASTGIMEAFFQVDVTGSATTKIMAHQVDLYSNVSTGVYLPVSMFHHLYVPPGAGTYTFQFQACTQSAGGGFVSTTLDFNDPILYAYEL